MKKLLNKWWVIFPLSSILTSVLLYIMVCLTINDYSNTSFDIKLQMILILGVIGGFMFTVSIFELKRSKKFYNLLKDIEFKLNDINTKEELQILHDVELNKLLNLMDFLGGDKFKDYSRIRDLIDMKLKFIN